MKSLRLAFLLCPVVTALSLPVPSAAETVKIETVLYLFKSKSVPHIDFSKALSGKPPISGSAIVVTPPATVVFDREELVLKGADYTWNGGSTVPARFAETRLPAIVTEAGQAATIRVTVPVQYLEKRPDGSLQLREVAGNLSDMPHYLLTLKARPTSEGPAGYGYDLVVSCGMDITTMQGREKIPGVDLEIGRPITARFDKHVEFWARKGEWFGLMMGQKESGDYTLWMLLKVSSAGPAPAAALQPVGSATAQPGFSVTAPTGSGWRKIKSDDGEVFENRIYPASRIDPGTFYRAGFSVVQAPGFPDRSGFLAFVKQAIKERADTSLFMSVQDDFVEREANGLWLVECSLNRFGWKIIAPDAHDAESNRIRILYALDPRNPGRVAVVWYGWHGVTFDEGGFNAEASAFLGSLQQVPR